MKREFDVGGRRVLIELYVKDFVVGNCKVVKWEKKGVGGFGVYVCLKMVCINGMYGCLVVYGIVGFVDVCLKGFEKLNVIVYI